MWATPKNPLRSETKQPFRYQFVSMKLNPSINQFKLANGCQISPERSCVVAVGVFVVVGAWCVCVCVCALVSVHSHHVFPVHVPLQAPSAAPYQRLLLPWCGNIFTLLLHFANSFAVKKKNIAKSSTKTKR